MGEETASPAESDAEDLHSAYASMPEHRQRRFWVRFSYWSSDNWENDLLKIYSASISCQCCSCRHQSLRRWRSWLTSWQLLRTIWKHARRKTPTILGRIFLKSHERFIDFLKGALAHAAGSVARSFLGDQDNAPDVATAAQNWHNAYAAMPEKRQRRFWVRFFF